MTLATNAFTSYLAVGNREDLTNMIYRISPTDTPFLSGIDKIKASNVLHEWQTLELAAASSTNAVLEGDEATADAGKATVRVKNYCQISRKSPRVTQTQEAIDAAGRGSEMALQEMIASKSLKTDLESALLASTTAYAAGNGTTVRRTAPVGSYLASNTSVATVGTTGVDAAGTGTDFRTDGTQRAFTESQLKQVLQLAWLAGGKPDTIMTGAFNKQQFSTFTGRGSPIEEAKTKKITASVDAYESDFGVLKVVANRFQRARDVFAFQMDMWAIAYLRPITSQPMGVTGDSIWKLIVTEFALEARNQKASAAVYDLTTS